ncbi:lipid phosphate phosphatase epsilon 1, chloroplastic-like [Rutidosis leptorrhynchoides]|uniref:lipid phosphate phosphatase epsilon 1, chloroplastic-like n=1 Tax=Rutidosis leptorrhynchoides TaxID=125765 RepID=UPI003A98D86C
MSISCSPLLTNFINPPISNKFLNFKIHRKTPFYNPAIRTSKIPEIVRRRSSVLKKPMAAESIETGIVGSDEHPEVAALEQEALIDKNSGVGVSFHRTPGGLHIFFNRSSKWIVAASFGGFVLLRHDALALWAATGAVLNVLLSVTLKQVLKQERPVSDVNSRDGLSSSHAQYGMPSSHAQSIFFMVVFFIQWVVKSQGLNGGTAILNMFVLALGSYFSWLRSFLRYHTTSQVIVGAVVGSIFSVLWLWTWEAIVHKAYNSSLWARIFVTVGGACFCVAFLMHVIQHWMKGED